MTHQRTRATDVPDTGLLPCCIPALRHKAYWVSIRKLLGNMSRPSLPVRYH